jgi:phenylacetate-CoA ligase
MTGIKKFIIFWFLRCAKYFRRVLSESEGAYRLLFLPGYEKTRWNIGKWKAWLVFENAKKVVPAYKDFLQKQAPFEIRVNGLNPDLSVIPPMDKETYIKKYSIEERCVYGRLPKAGVVVDESSGTSGSPHNWVRGPKERAAVKHALQTALHFLIGKEPVFFINAFALGPWATGMNVSMSFVDIAILKSTGPEVSKIESTLNLFGPKYHYVISGYPPFLKVLADTANVDWQQFDITVLYGGEGLSESMRDYLGKTFKKIYGSYGASDLEINIAAENDFTIALRKKLVSNKVLRNKIVKHGTLPMVFQYNPLDYYIESNKGGELLVTLCRKSNIAPKVRYNIHDLGHVLRAQDFKIILKESGLNLADIGEMRLDLPLMFHYGRSDMSVSFYGCKITPSEIEDIIFKDPKLAELVNSFSLITSEDNKMNKILVLALEMNKNKPLLKSLDKISQQIFESLKEINQDYRESSKMVPKGLGPKVEVYAFGEGPFAINDIRLKKQYIQER